MAKRGKYGYGKYVKETKGSMKRERRIRRAAKHKYQDIKRATKRRHLDVQIAANRKLGAKRRAAGVAAVGAAGVGGMYGTLAALANRKKLARLARRGLKVARKLVFKKIAKGAGSVRTVAALARWKRILRRRALSATQKAVRMARKR